MAPLCWLAVALEGFDLRRQIAELELVTSSPTAATTLAQHYTGLPLG